MEKSRRLTELDEIITVRAIELQLARKATVQIEIAELPLESQLLTLVWAAIALLPVDQEKRRKAYALMKTDLEQRVLGEGSDPAESQEWFMACRAAVLGDNE